jgi:large subunit ribosomal protein L21
MYAVIKTGGKQYRVKEGDVLAVEKLTVEAGHAYDFDQVMLIETDDKVLLGMPFIPGAEVRATAIETFKDDKIIVFKKKRKKQYRRTKGHRQQLTRVRIDEIVPDKSQAPERKPVAPVAKPAPAPAPAPAPTPAPAEKKAAPAEAKREPRKRPAPTRKAEKPAKPPAAPKAKKERKTTAAKPAAKPKPRSKKTSK